MWTGSKEWAIEKGDTVYVKKGYFSMPQFFDDKFCMFGIFIYDDFIRSTIGEIQGKIPLNPKAEFEDFSIKRINTNF